MEKRKRRLKFDHYGYFFIAPFFVVFSIFSLYSILYTVNVSFTNFTGWTPNYKYVGLDNYIWIFKNNFFWLSVGNTFILWLIGYVPQMIFSFLFAAIFSSDKLKLRGKGVFKIFYYMPNIITAASIAMIFNQLFSHPYGPIGQFLRSINMMPEGFTFFQSPTSARSIIGFIQFWRWYGHSMIFLGASIMSINPTFYEAARIDGASSTKCFFRITLPVLKPVLVYVFVSGIVGGLQIFDIPFLLVGGGPNYATETMATYIYKQAFTGQENYNIAAAASMVLTAIAVGLSVFVFNVLDRKEKEVKV